ncbi:MAG: porin [Gammaproteobacteria bacterium]|nr:porin [Gammaproteobacteria bacterium]
MNKKLLTLAFGAALAVPLVVQADTTAYAHVQFELANIDNGTDADMYVRDVERGRIGLTGNHDLGDGLEGFATVEFDYVGGNDDSEFGDATDTTTTDAANPADPLTYHSHEVRVRGNALRVREISAGLKGGFGYFEIGTLKSAYKYTGGYNYDAFVATTLEARGNYGMSGGDMGHNSFINNAMAYKNKFGPVDVWVTYSLDATDTDGDTIADDGQMTYAFSFNSGKFEAFLSGVDRGTSLSDYSSNKLGGKFNLSNNMAVLGQYEMNDLNGTDRDYLFLGFQMKQGKKLFAFQYGMRDTDDGVDNDADGTYMSLGAIHKYNNAVSLFAGYKTKEGEGNLDETILSAGLRVDI